MFKKFLNDETGQSKIEHILIVALITAVLVGVFMTFGSDVYKLLQSSINKVKK